MFLISNSQSRSSARVIILPHFSSTASESTRKENQPWWNPIPRSQSPLRNAATFETVDCPWMVLGPLPIVPVGQPLNRCHNSPAALKTLSLLLFPGFVGGWLSRSCSTSSFEAIFGNIGSTLFEHLDKVLSVPPLLEGIGGRQW